MLTANDLLTKFKASGVYTIYEDKTVSARLAASPILRLIVGYSKTGKFNGPVYIRRGDTPTATRLFGKRDKSLERKGSFFHKSLELALAEGDVLALNLWSLNNSVDNTGAPTSDADTAQYVSLSTDPITANGVPTTKLLASYFNKQKFWKADKNYLLATRKTADTSKILNFTNLSQTPATIFVTKSDIKGYSVKASDWYQKNTDVDMPAFVQPSDLISDYFIDVTVVNGNFGPDKWDTLSQDPVFSNYFNKAGLIPGKLTGFIGRNDISLRKVYTGCLIPNFVDLNKVQRCIEDVINATVDMDGLLCAIDRAQLEAYEDQTNTGYIDMVGHRLIDAVVSECQFLSYNFRLSNDFLFASKTAADVLTVTSTGLTEVYYPKKIRVTITNANPLFAALSASMVAGSTIIRGVPTATGVNNGIALTKVQMEVANLTKTSSSLVFDLVSPLKDTETATSGVFIDIDKTITTPETVATSAGITIGTPQSGTVWTWKVDKLDGNGPITLFTYTYSGGDTAASVRTELIDYVNGQTSVNGGFSLTPDGSNTAKFTINAPTGSGAGANSYVFSSVLTSGTALFSNSGTLLSGGVTAIFTFPLEFAQNVFKASSSQEALVAGIDTAIYTKWKAGTIQNGDKVVDDTTTKYVKFQEVRDVDGLYSNTADYRKLLKITFFSDSDLTQATTKTSFGATFYSNGIQADGSNEYVIQDTVSSIRSVVDAESLSETSVQMDIAEEANVKLFDYLVGLDVNNNKILTRIKQITRASVNSQSPNVINVTTEDKIYIYTDGSGDTTTKVQHYKPFAKYTLTLKPFYLPGYTANTAAMPDGTEDRLHTILNVITNTNLSAALSDPEMISFRYVVDTFNNGLEPNSKSQLSQLVMVRQKCLGLLNMPAMKEFAASQNPRFTSTPTSTNPLPEIDVQYIADGGNTAENPAFLYTLPIESQGASFVGFFGPNLTFDEGGQPVSICPAPLVSNNFLRKFSEGNAFKAVAGPRRGTLTAPGLVGLEYPLSKEERGLFEEKGLNPIYQKSSGDIVIAGIETAYQQFSSILNYLYARDTLISIEIDTEALLDPYTFEDNDDALKTEIQSVLGNYFDNLRDNVKCITSYKLIFDDSNNPAFLSREGAALVDTEVEIAGVVRKFINRLTLVRSGGVVSGGFTAI